MGVDPRARVIVSGSLIPALVAPQTPTMTSDYTRIPQMKIADLGGQSPSKKATVCVHRNLSDIAESLMDIGLYTYPEATKTVEPELLAEFVETRCRIC
jgi:hypothetical protein